MKLKSIEISNYTSFGTDIKVDFDDDSEILLIGNSDTEGCDSNGSGKTNFASAAFWCIFGIPLIEETSADEVIRLGESSCFVKVVLEDKDNILQIARTRNTNDYNTLIFHINDTLVNEKINVPSEVQKDINKYFGLKGTSKQIIGDILSTNFLSYNSVDMFVSKRVSSAERFAFISRMFDLDKWIECKEEAQNQIDIISPELSSLSGRLATFEERLGVIKPKELVKEIELLIEQKREKTETLKQYSNISSKIESLKLKASSLQTILENETASFRECKKFYFEKSDTINSRITEANNTINVLKTTISKVSDKYKDTVLADKLNSLTEEQASLQESLRVIEEKIDRQKVSIGEKLAIKDNALRCPACSAQLHYSKGVLVPFVLEEIEKEIKEFTDVLNELRKNKDTLLKSKSMVDASINEVEDTILALSLLEKEFATKEQLLVSLEEVEKEYCPKLDKKEYEIFQLNLSLTSVTEELDTIIGQDKEILFKESSLKNEILSIDESIYNNKALIEEHKRLVVSQAETKKRLDKLSKQIEIYKFWKKAFVDIRRLIIQSILPQLEEISNNYLQEMNVPFEIVLDTLREYKTTKNLKEEFNIKVNDNSTETTMPIHLRSTGERKRIGISVCMALLDLKEQINRKNLGFRFFDEVLDNLDESGIEAFLPLLSKTDYQNFVISHNDALKSRFSKVITIKKSNGVSII